MGIYTGSNGYDDNLTEVDVDMDELLEQFFYDDHYSDSDEEKRALFESSSELLEEKAFKTREEAEKWLSQTPIELEIYYEKGAGLFGVEAEALESASNTICSPYSKESFED